MLATSECYRRNMAALAELQPDVARSVETACIAGDVGKATGRDGTQTFLLPSTAGNPIWFGQSSMPSISAREVFFGFACNGGNVTLPGVLTGLEPLVIAERMPPHSAVFVAEQDAAHLRLAMHLHDYAPLLAAGRLVFLLYENGLLVESLTTFFERHPGYELPTSLLPVPQRSAAEIGDVQRHLEQAGEAVIGVQTRMVESCVERLRGRKFGPLPSAPALAVLSVDPQPVTLEQVRRIGRGLTELGWPHVLCAPDAPNKCHVLARLQAIENVGADLVLFVNDGAERLSQLLPDELPVASWCFSGASARPTTPGGTRRRDMVFAASRGLHAALVGAGLPAEVLHLCPPGADDTAYSPVEIRARPIGPRRTDVAVLVNLPDDRPEACNVSLPSHIKLWHALQDAVQRNLDACCDGLAEQLLDEAQRNSGTTIADPKVREHFLMLARTRIAPATIARSSVEALVTGNHHVAVWGSNWPPMGQGPDTRGGAIPAGKALSEVLNAASVVLLLDTSPWSVQTALDALAAGTAVVCRAPDEPFVQAYPELADLSPYLHLCRSLRELVDTVSRLTPRARSGFRELQEARMTVASKHSTAQRLRFMVDRIRGRDADLAARTGSDVVDP